MAKAPKSFDLVRLFAALADPTRLRLLNLMNGREVCVCYFVEILKAGPAQDLQTPGLSAKRGSGQRAPGGQVDAL